MRQIFSRCPSAAICCCLLQRRSVVGRCGDERPYKAHRVPRCPALASGIRRTDSANHQSLKRTALRTLPWQIPDSCSLSLTVPSHSRHGSRQQQARLGCKYLRWETPSLSRVPLLTRQTFASSHGESSADPRVFCPLIAAGLTTAVPRSARGSVDQAWQTRPIEKPRVLTVCVPRGTHRFQQ